MEVETQPVNGTLEVKNDCAADSPISVLEDEETTNRIPSEDEEKSRSHDSDGSDDKNPASEEETSLPLELEAKNGDTSLISKEMAELEEQLQAARAKEEEKEINEALATQIPDRDVHFSKLDELLTQTQLYSEFLMEKMDDISLAGVEVKTEEDSAERGKKRGRGRKRKATNQLNAKQAKKAFAAMLSRPEDGIKPEDDELTEEERNAKQQAELVPLLTGGKLKPYQLKGVKWMISLWQNGLNGILADQMGLGKTIQTIAFLAHLKGKGLHGPYLIVAPLSTLSNWVNEIARFTPSIKAVIYHGTAKERQEIRKKSMPRDVGPKFPFVITSYEIMMNDAKILSAFTWKYVVVDEGHRLKNTNCKLLREMRRMPMENKLLLTGTPLQNNLAELWSLLNFILPDIFQSYKEFESWFDFQEESDENRRLHVISKLHSILRPFLLRRVKDDVEKMLPRKKEIILYANMTEHQKELHQHLVNKTVDNYVLEKQEGLFLRPGMRGKINNLVMQMRKNCNHPDLIDRVYDESALYPPIEQLISQCGKFRLLDRLLNLLLAQKHKVLIFSQFTKVLDLLDYFLSEKGLGVCRIDGSVKLDERRKQIEDFNNLDSNVSVFLLSTRAGGLGINLTAADTCILYDSDWNPQMDLQAMDRCHRIGQTRPVHVYRLATAHSVEGRMLKRAFSKLKLEHVVIGKGHFEQERPKNNTLEDSELLALLREEEDEEDKPFQTDISDEDLLKVMDRSDLVGKVDSTGSELKNHAVSSLPLKGPGWEVVLKSGAGMLSDLGN